MGATTPNLNLYLPGGGSSGTIVPDEIADIDPLNENYRRIDDFAGTTVTRLSRQEAQNQQFTGPASSISGVSGMKLGDTYQETDGSKEILWYDGAAWRGKWEDLTLLSSFTNSSDPLQFRVTPNRVAVRGAVYRASAPTNFTAVAVLPSWVPAPYAQVRSSGRHDLGQQIAILKDRNIQLLATSAVTTGTGYTFDGTGYDY